MPTLRWGRRTPSTCPYLVCWCRSRQPLLSDLENWLIDEDSHPDIADYLLAGLNSWFEPWFEDPFWTEPVILSTIPSIRHSTIAGNRLVRISLRFYSGTTGYHSISTACRMMCNTPYSSVLENLTPHLDAQECSAPWIWSASHQQGCDPSSKRDYLRTFPRLRFPPSNVCPLLSNTPSWLTEPTDLVSETVVPFKSNRPRSCRPTFTDDVVGNPAFRRWISVNLSFFKWNV